MKKILSFTIVALFTFLLLELSCFAFFSTFQERFTFFNPAELTFDMKKIERAKRVFDAGLGWKHPYQTKFGERPRDLSFPQTWMATFGDSYTHCDQVQNNETYQHFLSKNLHMNVLNFGVGGYGTDQALLRFREAFPKVQSPVVAIGLITENINRIVNVFRKFYYPKTALSLSKPRFMLTKDQNLTLIPNPIQSSTEIEKLANPEFLATLAPYDYWYNRDQYPRLSFPYSA
ncbi:MAG: hypothetical protein KDD62_13255, partial [Bdellovibrionales bacterium]|nr:hypothetical protein [Bdellovibrionales bacterium]